MGKKKSTKPQNGYLSVSDNHKAFSGTLIITSLHNESDIYYAAINPNTLYDDRSHASIYLPPGNYILKIMGKDETRLISIVEGETSAVAWEI